MSDDQIMSDSTQAPEPAPTVLPPAPKMNLNVGRLLLFIAAGVAVLAIIVGIVLWVFMSSQISAPTTVVTPPVTGTGTGTGSTGTSGTLAPVATVTNAEVFTPRNPFEVIPAPTIGTSTSNSNSSSNSSSNSTTTTSATALTLTDIVTESGVRKAVVKLGGQTYKVAAGETVDTSNWKVVQINTSSVVFLYGDDRITISLGPGTSK